MPNEKVVQINGRYSEPPVTQLDLARAARLQAAAWNMHSEASVTALEIGSRIGRGAPVEDGDFFYDSGLNMVRTRRTASPPAAGPHNIQEALDFDGKKDPHSAGSAPNSDREVGS